MAEPMIPLTAEWAEFVERQGKENGSASSADGGEAARAELAAREFEAEGNGYADAEREERRQKGWLGRGQIPCGEGPTDAFEAAG
jgi:hypothetical protein